MDIATKKRDPHSLLSPDQFTRNKTKGSIKVEENKFGNQQICWK
jgi:hypothetical protein